MNYSVLTLCILISVLSLQARTTREKSMDTAIRQNASKRGFAGTGSVQYWISQGGHVNVPDERTGKTALHNAAGPGSVETVELLLKKIPANQKTNYILMKDKDGLNALHNSARNGKIKTFTLLLDNLPQDMRKRGINSKDNLGMTPLHLAIKSGFKDMVQLLLDKGADIQQRIKNGMTPLHLADWRPDMIELLIKNVTQNKRNAFVNAVNQDKRNALHFVAIRGNAAAAQKLIAAGITIDAKNFQNRTPLHEAANMGHTSMVLLLLKNIPAAKKSAFINEQDNLWGRTALHEAAAKGYVEVVKALIENGADKTIKDKLGKTALQLAQEKKQQAVVSLLNK